MCFNTAKPKAPAAPPPPVSQGASQVLDASEQTRKAALLRKGQQQTLFGGTQTRGEQGMGQAGGQQFKSLLG